MIRFNDGELSDIEGREDFAQARGVLVKALGARGEADVEVALLRAGAKLHAGGDQLRVEQGAQRGAPKYMEWYSAFGLMVTLVWLYLEIIRLLSKLRGDDRR